MTDVFAVLDTSSTKVKDAHGEWVKAPKEQKKEKLKEYVDARNEASAEYTADLKQRYTDIFLRGELNGCLREELNSLWKKISPKDEITSEALNVFRVQTNLLIDLNEEREAEQHEIGKKFGAERLTTEEDVNRFLRRRRKLTNELDAIKKQYQTLITRTQNALTRLEERWGEDVETVAREHCQEEKIKTWRLPYGTIKFISHQESLTIEDEEALQFWLPSLTPALKSKYKIAPVKFSRDLVAIKADWMPQYKKGADLPPGLKYNEPGVNCVINTNGA